MGYDIHITRAGHWTESNAHPITLNEWLARVAADPELEIDTRNGSLDEPFVLWVVGGVERSWFQWWRGEITTKSPSRAVMSKVLALATHFRATVQGDEGEVYTAAEEWPEPGERDDL